MTETVTPDTVTPDTVTPPADVVPVVPAGRVVYGMQLPVQSQSSIYVAEWETHSGPAELARVAVAADDSGFFYLGVCDHTAIPERGWPGPWAPSGTTPWPPWDGWPGSPPGPDCSPTSMVLPSGTRCGRPRSCPPWTCSREAGSSSAWGRGTSKRSTTC